MKNSQRGFVVPLLIVMALLVIGGGIYIYQNNKKSETNNSVNFYSQVPGEMSAQNFQNVPTNTANPAPVTESHPGSNWKTYSNIKYNYSIQYPSNWYVNTQYSDSDFTPRGPAPSNYIGGDTSISNYSQADIDNYQRKNGEAEYPADLIHVNLSFWKISASASLTDALKTIGVTGATKTENITLNGISGVKLTTINQTGIGGATKANNVGIWLKVNGELVNIGYGYDSSNSSAVINADKIINSFTMTQ